MTQRVALARAFLHEPSILLLDEAESGLDVRAHEVLVGALRVGARTAVLATHDLAFAREVADEVAFLRRGTVVGRVATAGRTVSEIQAAYAEALARRSDDRPRVPIPTGG
jgi:polar amino acid transport system ATP-binding protein